LLALLIALALITLFPQLVLWVPTLFGYKPIG
jgi:Flp pilus assembly pilin Flp